MTQAMPKITRRKTLSAEVTQRLREAIESGQLEVGAKLPTEQELSNQMEVSRTVVREAVAALKADGLVKTRQGVGAFVAELSETEHFRVDREKLGSIQNVLDLLELRIGLETDMAGFAAERASEAHVAAIFSALETIDDLLQRGEDSVEADFQFHLAIAKASRNSYFVDFVRFLGTKTVPSRELVTEEDNSAEYVKKINSEHRAIAEAIAAHDVEAARTAARSHLTGSLKRHAEKARSVAH